MEKGFRYIQSTEISVIELFWTKYFQAAGFINYNLHLQASTFSDPQLAEGPSCLAVGIGICVWESVLV